MAASRCRIAFAADEEFAELDDNWPYLTDALQSVGLVPSVAYWDDPTVDWIAYDMVLPLFAWGYVSRRTLFLGWVDEVVPRTHLVNAAPVLHWNSDKRYLADLAAADIPIVPTQWVSPGTTWRPPSEDYVIKPTVGSGGLQAARYVEQTVDSAIAHVARLHDEGLTAMVQPYQGTVDAAGETALIFIDGRYSHAVNKSALLEADVGVTDALWKNEVITSATPRDDQRAVADQVIAAVEARFGPTGYGRVDLVDGSGGRPLVLEVELIEPSLFLRHRPEAAGGLAAHLARRARHHPG